MLVLSGIAAHDDYLGARVLFFVGAAAAMVKRTISFSASGEDLPSPCWLAFHGWRNPPLGWRRSWNGFLARPCWSCGFSTKRGFWGRLSLEPDPSAGVDLRSLDAHADSVADQTRRPYVTLE